jgi:hypothetical protein
MRRRKKGNEKMRKDLPEVIAKLDLNAHPLADTMRTIISISEKINPQGINPTKAENYTAHIYNDLFQGKESNLVFLLTLANLISRAHSIIELKYGVDIPHADIPKK